MTRQTSVQITEATDQQIATLQKLGFGTFTDIVRISIDRMHNQEAEMTERREDRMASELDSVHCTEGAARPLTRAERDAYPGDASVDVAICRNRVWYYGDSDPTEEDPTGLDAAQFVQDEGGDYVPVRGGR